MLQSEFGEHHYGRIDLTLKKGQAEKALTHFASVKVKNVLDWPVARREDLDGLKLFLGDIGWVLVRKSGTEHMLRVYSETNNPSNTQRVLQEVAQVARGL
jgi:phosphomannomutase